MNSTERLVVEENEKANRLHVSARILLIWLLLPQTKLYLEIKSLYSLTCHIVILYPDIENPKFVNPKTLIYKSKPISQRLSHIDIQFGYLNWCVHNPIMYGRKSKKDHKRRRDVYIFNMEIPWWKSLTLLWSGHTVSYMCIGYFFRFVKLPMLQQKQNPSERRKKKKERRKDRGK